MSRNSWFAAELLGSCILAGCATSAALVQFPSFSTGALNLNSLHPYSAGWLLVSPDELQEAATNIPNATVTPDQVGNPVGSGINPLTGLQPSDPSLLERRALAIKISNYPRDIRPQYGLNLADVVFEYYIEWGYTRFIGIFYGKNAAQIGPVRSGRYFDEHISRMYHAYYIFNFADPREYTYFIGSDLRTFLVVPGYGECPPFFQFKVSSRISDVRHFETYFDSTRFGDCLDGTDPDNVRQQLRASIFKEHSPPTQSIVKRIYTHYSRCDYNYWQYDDSQDRYLRFQETSRIQTPAHVNDCSDKPETYAPLTDAVTNHQVAADNVVVIFVPHIFSNDNEAEDEIYHIELVDSGEAFVFRNGVGIPARWLRMEMDQPLLLMESSGALIGLKPGTTFYEVVGETSSTWSDGSDWHFDFHTP